MVELNGYLSVRNDWPNIIQPEDPVVKPRRESASQVDEFFTDDSPEFISLMTMASQQFSSSSNGVFQQRTNMIQHKSQLRSDSYGGTCAGDLNNNNVYMHQHQRPGIQLSQQKNGCLRNDSYGSDNSTVHLNNNDTFIVDRRSGYKPMDEDVFIKPAGFGQMESAVKSGQSSSVWEDITSSIRKLDPENSDLITEFTTNQGIVRIKTEIESPTEMSPCSFDVSKEIKQERFSPPPVMTSVYGTANNSGNYVQSFKFTNMGPQFAMSRVYLPPGPASSLSVGGECELSPPPPSTNAALSPENFGGVRLPPPPPYPAVLVSTSPGIRYSRRTPNPELEKRRIHNCDYPGKFL